MKTHENKPASNAANVSQAPQTGVADLRDPLPAPNPSPGAASKEAKDAAHDLFFAGDGRDAAEQRIQSAIDQSTAALQADYSELARLICAGHGGANHAAVVARWHANRDEATKAVAYWQQRAGELTAALERKTADWQARKDEAEVFGKTIAALQAQLDAARSEIVAWQSLAPDLAQLLQGWHADGTAWSEWDQSVYDKLLALQARTARAYDGLVAIPKAEWEALSADGMVIDKTEWSKIVADRAACYERITKLAADLAAQSARVEELQAELEIRTRQRDYWQQERHTLLGSFKNFHRNLCKRFGYGHDDDDWWRDQARLEEHIAKIAKDKDRLEWCAENEIQFGVEHGSCGHPDRWIVYQKQRWDLPLGVGPTFRAAMDAARLNPPSP